MSLAIVGTGLVTPFGDTPTEHAFFLRASVPAPPPSPFRLRSDESTLHVRYCRWMGASASIAERLLRMGDLVARDAMSTCAAVRDGGDVQVMLTVPKDRPGVTGAVLDELSKGLAQHGTVQRFAGDAGAFEALRRAGVAVRKREARVIIVAAVDSFVDLEALDELVLRTPSEWNLDAPVPSEGAAAVALMDADDARNARIAVLGEVQGASVARGQSNDDNDEVVDGSAMTVVLRSLPTRAPAMSAFGPLKVDLLRQDEWHLATARTADRFAPGCTFACLESRVGRLGAASGLANLVYGLVLQMHRAGPSVEASSAPFYAWAVSADGTRGAAVVVPRGP